MIQIVFKKLSKPSPISKTRRIFLSTVYVDPPNYIGQSKTLTYDFIKRNVKNPPDGIYGAQFIGGYCGISPLLWEAKFTF